MKRKELLLRAFKVIGLAFALSICTSAYAGWFGFGSDSWNEEVLLHDGSRFIAKRTVKLGGRHEIGQPPPIKDQSLRFTLPGTGRTVVWEDNHTKDVGGANFLPMLLDIYQGTPYLIAYPMGCLSYNKWGRPNPPYVIFKYDGVEWQRIALQELPTVIQKPNLIFSSPDVEAKRIGKNPIPAEAIAKLISDYRQPEYKTILREPLTRGRCPLYHAGPKAPNPMAPRSSEK